MQLFVANHLFYISLVRENVSCMHASGRIPPEIITDTTPLIRTKSHREPKPLTRDQLSRVIRRLYTKAGLIPSGPRKRYDIRAHSLRKYFKTQLTALGIPREYIEYMMRHKISTYQDVKMKGIDFLRNMYAASHISVQHRTKMTRASMLKEIIRAWGYDPEKILITEALAEPHRTICKKTYNKLYQETSKRIFPSKIVVILPLPFISL